MVVLSIILLPALTVLVTVDKVFEQLLAGQLEPLSNKVFVGLNSCLNSTCRKRYCCETTLVRLVEDWKRSLDNNHTAGVLSADMSKAFDCLSPNLLLSKLQAYVLCRSCSNSLALLKSYFTNKKNRVRLAIGDTCGEWKAQTRMPQGVITWSSVVEFLSKWSVLWKRSFSTECLRWRPPDIYFGWEDWQRRQQSWGGRE